MTVARYVDPNYTTQTAAQYKANLDAAAKVMKRLGDWFAPHQVYAGSPNPDLAVELDAGWVFKGSTLTEIAAQTVTGFTIPSAGQNRVDRVVLDPFTGAARRVAGTAVTGSPSATAPAIPAGTIPICQVYITSSDTVITDAMITDERVHAGVDLMLDADLIELFHVNYQTGHRDLAAARYDPAFFNQQWGGAPHYFEMVDGATGTPYRFEMATGYIDVNTIYTPLAGDAAHTQVAQSFKVSKGVSVPAIWVKVYKYGNPTNNLELRLYTDTGGVPNTGAGVITNGTATAISGKLFSSDANGQWVRFSFATPPALTANTTYHMALKSSGAVDGSNYWIWALNTSGKYPHGNVTHADGTPTWSTDASGTYDAAFMVEQSSSVASLQTGGLFSDGKLTFFEGSPLNQSNGRVKDLKDFRGLDLTDFTLLVRGTAWTKDKTILEFQYGMDHDRIVLRSNVTTGYAQLDVYDSGGTKRTVTGTTDVSTGDHDIMIRVRAKGDGSDALYLYVDGSSQGTPITAATISFDTLFGLAQIGTFWIGGGFALASTWTKDTTMGSLPSADGWTWTGTGTEANCMSVSGGKLYQNKNGYASTDTGYYKKTTLSLSNANGWAYVDKERTASGTNTAGAIFNPFVVIDDGTKQFCFGRQEYFTASLQAASADVYSQIDNKSVESVTYVVGKGSDALVFKNGRLSIDYSTLLTKASASSSFTGNSVNFGDIAGGAGENADAVWDYVKYYNTAWLPPQFTAGSLSELAIWTGDKTSLASSLYNSGTFVSVKQYCGLRKNYLDEIPFEVSVNNITSNPTYTTLWTNSALLAETEAYFIGGNARIDFDGTAFNSSISFTIFQAAVDGIGFQNRDIAVNQHSNANYYGSYSLHANRQLNFGLHKAEIRIGVSGDTTTVSARRMTVRAKV